MSVAKSIRLPVSANLKIMLVVMAALIVGGTLFYTQQLVRDLRRSEYRTIRFYVNTLQRSLSTLSPEMGELHLILLETIDFPVILTDTNRAPLEGYNRMTNKKSFNDYTRNVNIDSTLPLEVQRKALQEYIADMGARHAPLKIYSITGQDSTLMNYLYYDDSPVVKQLAWLPYIQILIGSMFILVGYLSFSHIKRNEQSNIWVGMAKETAHQLGTPISSLMGWVELLKYDPQNAEQVIEAADEMHHDIERLNKVSQRFSKIGATPELIPTDLNKLVSEVVTYFERRLPHLGKRVMLTAEYDGTVHAAANIGLMEWVLENLVRNAADAIEAQDGHIRLRVGTTGGDAVIDVTDNGKGIDPKIRNDVFRPGFSTKQRGWGLGLSLAKRIVEEYHGGKITIHESSSKGTTFRIRLKAVQPTTQQQPTS